LILSTLRQILSERITGLPVSRREGEKLDLDDDEKKRISKTKKLAQIPRRNAAIVPDRQRRGGIEDGGAGAKSIYQTHTTPAIFGKGKTTRTAGIKTLIEILHKHPLGRTTNEKSFIFDQLRPQEAFKTIKNDILVQIAGIVNLNEYPDVNTVIFSQGEIGREWFVLLEGFLYV
jgi:hypothetical protein